jgi:hypothetical protein
MKKMRMSFIFFWLALAFNVAIFFTATGVFISKAQAAELIAVADAHEKVIGEQALLVCAYNSDETFNKMRLKNAIPLSEFKEKLATVDMEKMIIFYCA